MSHLGGHMGVTHVDPGGLKLMRSLGVKQLLDVGCGPGGQVIEALRDEYEFKSVIGVDGDTSLRDSPLWRAKPEHFRLHNFYLGTLTPGDLKDKWGEGIKTGIWCCEFLEHVHPDYLACVMQTFRHFHADVVVCTHALPGDEKELHPNCRFDEYWHGAFNGAGYKWSKQETARLRRQSEMEREFVALSGNVYLRV